MRYKLICTQRWNSTIHSTHTNSTTHKTYLRRCSKSRRRTGSPHLKLQTPGLPIWPSRIRPSKVAQRTSPNVICNGRCESLAQIPTHCRYTVKGFGCSLTGQTTDLALVLEAHVNSNIVDVEDVGTGSGVKLYNLNTSWRPEHDHHRRLWRRESCDTG